ncbi:unnamed protein product [Protopolystoma xenopodis]|uniref:Uncharacterized protein n=1 Tax=Protopolystoma xenopodis TaxID=117903 RepID=A0A448XP77_9PLAT|nr:unnamed protein product [Protopolystoma xenopodis]
MISALRRLRLDKRLASGKAGRVVPAIILRSLLPPVSPPAMHSTPHPQPPTTHTHTHAYTHARMHTRVTHVNRMLLVSEAKV